MSDCLFCGIIQGQIPSQKVYEDDHVFAFRDVQPQAPHHILIVPKKHIAKLADCGEQDQQIFGQLLHTAVVIARSEGLEDGYRVVINSGETAGQSVWHLHVHLLSGRPFRWPPG
jgi:histidine triad (HIT) family protein